MEREKREKGGVCTSGGCDLDSKGNLQLSLSLLPAAFSRRPAFHKVVMPVSPDTANYLPQIFVYRYVPSREVREKKRLFLLTLQFRGAFSNK